MAITSLTKQRLGPQIWLLEWASDLGGTPTFYVYIDGILALSTTRTSHRFQVAEGEQLAVEVLDNSATAPATVYPGTIRLQWEPVSSAAKYLIQQYIDAAWFTVRTVLATSQAMMSHVTPILNDQTTYQFRVLPVGSNGIEGTARAWTIAMVRRPDVVTVNTATYSSGTGLVTLSVA